jgi:hypothetical protein
VCINPFHYTPVHYQPFLTTLIEGLTTLGLVKTNETISRLVSMRNIVDDDKLLFETLCQYIRCAPIHVTNPMAHLPTGPDPLRAMITGPSQLQRAQRLATPAAPASNVTNVNSLPNYNIPQQGYMPMPQEPKPPIYYFAPANTAQLVPTMRPVSATHTVPSLPPRGFYVSNYTS